MGTKALALQWVPGCSFCSKSVHRNEVLLPEQFYSTSVHDIWLWSSRERVDGAIVFGWSGRLEIRQEVLCLCCTSWKWWSGWKEILCSPVVELRAHPVLELTSVELTSIELTCIGAHQSSSEATPFLFLHCPLSPESISHQMVDFSRYNPAFHLPATDHILNDAHLGSSVPSLRL